MIALLTACLFFEIVVHVFGHLKLYKGVFEDLSGVIVARNQMNKDGNSDK